MPSRDVVDPPAVEEVTALRAAVAEREVTIAELDEAIAARDEIIAKMAKDLRFSKEEIE